MSDPPLDPSPDEARSLLRRELRDPEYREDGLVERLLTGLLRWVDGWLDAAAGAPPLSTLAAMLVLLLLAGALAWLLGRARRTATLGREVGAVLGDERVTARELRARAEAALAADLPAAALVDGFRALTLRQVERGRLEDLPQATAHEVADALASSYPEERQRVLDGALLFDSVLYGGRAATRDQASAVLALDDALAGSRAAR